MTTKTKKAPAKPEKPTKIEEDGFESLENEDLTLDEGLNDNNESTLDDETETTSVEGPDDLPDSLDDIEDDKPPVNKTKKEEPKKNAKEKQTTVPKKPGNKHNNNKTEEINNDNTDSETTLSDTEDESDTDDVETLSDETSDDGTDGSDGSDGDSDELTEEEIETPQPTKKEKPVTTKKEKVTIEKYSKELGGVLDNEFPMSKIKTDKFDIRKTPRSEQKITDLANDIHSRGQAEPIHVVKDGKFYQIVAGFHRYFANKQLKNETIRAIYYDTLNESQIQVIAVATNSFRSDLSEWDKVCTVAEYHERFPKIPIDSKNPNDETLKTIFGYAKSTLYDYINVYTYIRDFKNPKLMEFIQNNQIPRHYMTGLYNAREHIKPEDTDKIITLFKERPDLRIKEFDIEFMSFLNEIHLDSNDEGLEETDGEIKIPTTGKKKSSQKEIQDALNDDDESDENKELKRNCRKKVNDIINKLTEIHTILTEFVQYDNIKELTEDKLTKVLIKRSTDISKLSSKLFN